MTALALAAALLLSAETPPAAAPPTSAYQAREKGLGHVPPADRPRAATAGTTTAGTTTAKAAPATAPAQPAKAPSPYRAREQAGHLQPAPEVVAPAAGEKQ